MNDCNKVCRQTKQDGTAQVKCVPATDDIFIYVLMKG